MSAPSAVQKASFFIHNEVVRANAVASVAMVPADGSAEVLILPIKSKVSSAQRGLYRGVWLPAIRRHENNQIDSQGYTESDLHELFKESFMAGIFLDGPESRTQREWVDAYDLAKELGADKDQLKRVKRLVSTEWANKSQYAKYLTRIEDFCMKKGWPLLRPDDQYYDAIADAQ